MCSGKVTLHVKCFSKLQLHACVAIQTIVTTYAAITNSLQSYSMEIIQHLTILLHHLIGSYHMQVIIVTYIHMYQLILCKISVCGYVHRESFCLFNY